MAKKIKRQASKRSVPDVVRSIRPVEDIMEKHVALFYAKAGRGKTATAATWPKPILFLDINNERGLKTIRNEPDIEFAQVRNWNDADELYWWLRDGQDYETIVLDQITGLQDLAIADLRERRHKHRGDLITQKNWGEISGEMKTLLENYAFLCKEENLYNIVLLGHERAFGDNDEDEDSDIDPSVGARVMPSVGSLVDGMCDIIGQNFIRRRKTRVDGKIVYKTEYCMRLGPHPTYVTKIRRPPDAGPIPAAIVNPSYQKLVAIEAGEEIHRKPKRRK